MKEVRNRKYQVAQPLLLSIMIAIGMLIGFQLNPDSDQSLLKVFPGEQDIELGRVEEVIRIMDSKYLFAPDAPALTDELIKRVFAKLDPYSMYIPEKDLAYVNDNMNGNYKGIGIETIFVNDTLLISDVLKGSPADLAGLQKLDRIVSIDSISISGNTQDFDKFRKKIQSSGNLESHLVIYRKKTNEDLDIKLMPDKVENPSIRHYLMLNDTTLYIKIDQFVSKTYREFMEVLESVQIESKLPYLIIDVRNNPGGYLTEVTKILSQFFDESDKILVKTVIRNGGEKEYKTTGRNFFEIGDISVLINQNSASGSEVLAGALQDWDRATVIGKRSYGKGLVQEQYELSQGGAIRLTVANYYLPSGRSIQHAFDLDTAFFTTADPVHNANGEYHSLINQRKLYGSKGIEPDVLIEDSTYVNIVWPKYVRDRWLDEKIINYLDAHPDFFELNAGYLKNDFRFEKSELEQFKWWKEVPDGQYPIDDEMLEALIRAKMVYFLFDDQTALGIVLALDPYIL